MDARIPGHRRLSRRAGRVIRLLPWIAVGALTLGCTLDSVIAGAGLPGTTVDAVLGTPTERGAYLDTSVDAGGFQYRLFFPNEPGCKELLSRPSGLQFVWLGVMGRVTDGDERCDAVGVLSLLAWRDRQPRFSREPLPRAPARYELVYRDDDLVQLRGRFPLARELGFTGSQNMVVVLPNEGPCQRFVDVGTASMEFRASGPHPLTLISGNELCRVLGLAQPPPPSRQS